MVRKIQSLARAKQTIFKKYKPKPNKVRRTYRTWGSRVTALVVAIAFGITGIHMLRGSHAVTFSVPGQSYNICDLQSTYLTSPWTYHALSSGSQHYTVAQYQALSGYGSTLPPLPSYISSQNSSTIAAVIFAPGSTDINAAAYNFPKTPILHFFEGGAYGQINLQSISGDQFIGGSTTGFPLPTFNGGGGAGGINAGNDSYGWSGNATTLASSASIGATTITTTSSIAAYATKITFADGTTYGIAGGTATSVQLDAPLTSAQTSGSSVYTNSNAPIATLNASKAQGITTVTLGASSVPLVQYGHVVIGANDYEIDAVSGSQSGYTLTFSGGLDIAAAANTPVYYSAPAGNVTVSYLDISNDLHTTTGTLTLGQGWEVSHNKIHDSYRNPGEGVAIYGGDQSTVEYNCFSKIGNYAGGGDGVDAVFTKNEVTQTPYLADPGCGCSGVGKWWGSLNADITDNYFTENGVGEGQPVIWLDNGNSGTNISGNYFYHNQGKAVESETGFNLSVTNNLFKDNNWGTGAGCNNSNCVGAVDLNSTGGFHVPNSRYDDMVEISGNRFENNWGGVSIWQSGLRGCASSGEGFPGDAAYCTGGFPSTELAAQGGEYYFSHMRDNARDPGDTTNIQQDASSGATTILVRNAQAINDQIGFADPVSTTTTSTTNVTTFNGSQSINGASTASFPSSGQLRVDTSAAGGGGGYTGAILAYTGKTGTTFTGISLIRGSGTLSGAVLQVQPYRVVSQTCYANDCKLTISPALSSPVTTGTTVTSAGTCALFATGVATPTSPLAPNGTSYYDGCQWGTKHISVDSNTFIFDPNYIATHATVSGSPTTTCDASHTNSCGTNFMMFQTGGTAPYNKQIDGNAMMSNSSFTGCPQWESGCTTNPLSNLNALSNAPGSPGSNNEAPSDNFWDYNDYQGPWAFNAYDYGPCNSLPSDPVTGHSMPTNPSPCSLLDFGHWQAYWMQDPDSTYSSTVLPDNDADINQDGHVNFLDLSALANNYGKSGGGITIPRADINGDGTVNFLDLSALASQYGT